ncbi:MAG: MFS transporter [Elusimicrobiaceae bacterium]|nr:MFS transporter [Elusimicrobiaceae bacterium]
MKKIIAVLLSINLLVLNASPVLAQVAPRKLAQGFGKAIQVPAVRVSQLPARVKTPAVSASFGKQLEQAALNGMRLPLTQNYAALLGSQNPLLPPARQILAHHNAKERALLLRSDFVALALNGKASFQDIETAADFYRTHLKAEQKVLFEGMVLPATGTVADIASLGLLGTKADGKLIYQTARKALGTGQEAIITAAAARALLRLQAYAELEALSRVSTVQPVLWEGLAQYVQAHKLPVYIFGSESGVRKAIDISAAQKDFSEFGLLNQVVINPSVESTYLYMNAGLGLQKNRLVQKPVAVASKAAILVEDKQIAPQEIATVEQTGPVEAAVAENFVVAPTQTAALAMAENTAAQNGALAPIKAFFKKITPKPFDPTQPATAAQLAALYLTAFSIGLEIGTPIMASIKTALNLPLTSATLVMAATFSPYLFGSFIANWLKTKIGRKGTINTGLVLAGGSFALGATVLGFDGSFTAWEDPMAQYKWLLAALTAASTGCVFIHNAVGPVMTEISKHANDLVRQTRGAYVELSRSVGMMASFAFPFIATKMLGMDWSAPFLFALPIVGGSALALNLAKLPNTKPVVKKITEMKVAQSPVMEGFKPRKGMKWKNSILNNSYVRLLREEPGVGSFVSALFLMNAVEVAYQSGFLFMIPQLAANESDQYLFGMVQYAVAFLAGRCLAPFFLKWFPNRNVSIATLIAASAGIASLAATHNPYALTAALFTAELGISTGFTLAFARTAHNHATQDRVTSLIMATAIACAVGPYLLTKIAQGLMGAGILGEGDATITALLAIPSALALLAARLFRRMENKTIPGLKESAQGFVTKIKQFFKRK